MKIYENIYEYYINQIENNTINAGDKMPSLRESVRTFQVSRTSVETAYLQLAADGYIYSVDKVGYYVSDMAVINGKARETLNETKNEKKFKYDLATIGEDKSVSCLNLWRRYMKSALRQEDRLLNYAVSQGEGELRKEIASHVRKTRNIICSSEDVVIGAGFQNLLQILIALIDGDRTISFPTRDFSDGAFVFENAGYEVNYRDKESHVIYVTPAYMTKWGEVMTMKRRRELITHAMDNNHLIIEDDYQNDFVFSKKPTPSLYAMTGGRSTAFLGSFSRVLLPSVRISYLILPMGTREKYANIRGLYNQTVSMAEQIALTQFLRDGHLNRHIKKLKKCYNEKRQLMIDALIETLDNTGDIMVGDSGMEIGIHFSDDKILKRLEKSQVRFNKISAMEQETMLLLSCSSIDIDDIRPAIVELTKDIKGKAN